MSSFDIKIPDKMVLGLCECLAGVLLVVAPIPGSTVVGATLIGDGIRRVIMDPKKWTSVFVSFC